MTAKNTDQSTTGEQRNALPVGYEFDGYRIDSLLGSGGFGITYRATELSINRTVAIKEFLPASMAWRSSEDLGVHAISDMDTQTLKWGRSSFQREAETLVNFRHENVVSVLRFFEANGTAYMVMAYEEGESLGNILRDTGTLGQDEMEEVLFPLLNALEEVHHKGFLHRDIKPSNIYIRRDGSPVLLDFGAAKEALGERSHSLNVVLTPPFAPMEQYSSGESLGPWTDIYALGMTLLVCATKVDPPDAMARSNAVMGGRGDPMKPPPKTLGKKFNDKFKEAVSYATRLLQEDRPQTVAEWRRCFREGQAPEATRILGASQAGMGARAAGEKPAKGANKAWPIAAGVAGLLAIGGVGYAAYQHMNASDGEAVQGLRAELTSMTVSRDKASQALASTRTQLSGLISARAARAKRNMLAVSEMIGHTGSIKKKKEDAAKLYKQAQRQYFDRRDYKAAHRIYLSAARLGHADAQSVVAYMYYIGQGVKRDYARAFRWNRRAAELGNAAAKTTLAHLYTLGQGTKKDYALAIIWAGRAVIAGSLRGYCHLGNLHSKGLGVPRNDKLAFNYFRAGAQKRDRWCMFEVGKAYENGAGVQRNRAQAVRWYRLSADKGDSRAREALKRLLK
jgi:hypothetical protein